MHSLSCSFCATTPYPEHSTVSPLPSPFPSQRTSSSARSGVAANVRRPVLPALSPKASSLLAKAQSVARVDLNNGTLVVGGPAGSAAAETVGVPFLNVLRVAPLHLAKSKALSHIWQVPHVL